jgi:SAM-dependent methyltransferase
MDRAAYDRMRTLQANHWWFEGRRRILSSLIERLDLPKPARILEAGCGPGGNIGMLQRFGEVVALEPDAASRAYAAEMTGARIEAGALPGELPFAPGAFDLVGAFDVIEHVDDDKGAVAALSLLLKRGGHLAATVPGQPWMWSRHDELHHHRRRYRLAPFRRLFEEAGLSVVKASYFNTFLFPMIAVVRAAKIAVRSRAADDEALPPASLNAALTGLFAAEKSWLAHADLPVGVSIVVIARRP